MFINLFLGYLVDLSYVLYIYIYILISFKHFRTFYVDNVSLILCLYSWLILCYECVYTRLKKLIMKLTINESIGNIIHNLCSHTLFKIIICNEDETLCNATLLTKIGQKVGFNNT